MKTEWKKYYVFLENLRKSGKTNMFGATPYLQEAFGLDRKYAHQIVLSFMQNYNEIVKEVK